MQCGRDLVRVCQGAAGLAQVRLWRVERSQKDILKWMRADGPGLDPKRELLAYWKFDDPDTCALRAA